jgi:thiosulfate dehydrogenase
MVAAILSSAHGMAAEDGEKEDRSDYVSGSPSTPSEAWMLASGGRLYDNWIEALDQFRPEGTHPAWPESNSKKKGATTWRCKSCHGWEYQGRDGHYRTGSYKTGIKGIRDWAGRQPNLIARVLRSPPHGFTEEMIPPDAMERLALFVGKGQHDADAYIDRRTGAVKGDARRGGGIFQNVCASCHGFDGRALDWGDDDEPGYVGSEAKANPWEVLHKIRNGHPGAIMVALRAFPIQDAVDVLAFARTLPEK